MTRLALALCVVATLCISAQAQPRPLPDKKPHAWCGWWLRHHVKHDPGIAYNLARLWAKLGHALSGPQFDAIVVWRHHVGKIVSSHPDAQGRWLVVSGNDGGRVRTRPRSLRGAIAFRHYDTDG